MARRRFRYWFLVKSKQPISLKKKQDLVGLCEKGIIPEEFHHYYETLPVSASVGDKNPCPSVDEESDEDNII